NNPNNIVIFYFSVFVSFVAGESIECPQLKCSDIEMPVCAGDGVNPPKTFTNYCQFLSYNCPHGNHYKVLYNGTCECPMACTEIYDPVCAGDGANPAKTFSSLCFMELYNCRNKKSVKVLQKGECHTQSECPAVCPFIYDPVCASDKPCDYRTFSNNCSLNMYNCNNGKNLSCNYGFRDPSVPVGVEGYFGRPLDRLALEVE
ncbi:unnamed protein product, partial [Timema podura]|nr:unnamed protein product [Timema podura]